MKNIYQKYRVTLLIFCLLSVDSAFGQQPLFEGDNVLRIEISGNLSMVLDDTSILPGYVPQILRLVDPVADSVRTIPIELKARGNFRRLKADCDHIPLMIKFSNSMDVAGTAFENQKKLKLVLPCRAGSYVIKEWLVYKFYNLINPDYSFKTRLVELTLTDPATGYSEEGLIGFLIENEKSIASRNEMSLIESIVTDDIVDIDTYRRLTLFQYMIANTDWSIPFLHNIKVMRKDSLSAPIPVPYDFDLTGMVDAPYAISPPALELQSVKERMYRGYCLEELDDMLTTINYFNSLRSDITQLIKSTELLDADGVQESISFIDEFYRIINDPIESETALMAPCEPGSKANVVIMGLGY
jgi:hypothetical protein